MDGLRVFRALLVVVILATVQTLDAQVVEVDLGGLILAVSDSTTGQVFHIVDQLSEWDQFAHKQYGRWARTLPLNQEDRRLLQQHADLRRARSGPAREPTGSELRTTSEPLKGGIAPEYGS